MSLIFENGNIRSVHFCIKEILLELEPQSSSMSDGLHLRLAFRGRREVKCWEEIMFLYLMGEIDAKTLTYA